MDGGTGDVTASVSYGAVAGTATQGNDARITGIPSTYATIAGPNFTGYATFAGQITAQAGLVVSGGTLSGTGALTAFLLRHRRSDKQPPAPARSPRSRPRALSAVRRFLVVPRQPARDRRTAAAAGSFTSLSASGNLTVTGSVTNNGYVFINWDYPELVLAATASANTHKWRLVGGLNGASTDGTLTIQHTTDNFVSNFTNSLVLDTSGGLTVRRRYNEFGALNISGQGVPLVLNNTAGSYRLLEFTTANVARWEMGVGNDAESGSNAGATFNITAFADSGAYIASPLSITRSSGLTSISNGLTVSGATTLTVLSPHRAASPSPAK